LTTLKTAAFAAMPIAIVSSATVVKAASWRSARSALRTSSRKSSSDGQRQTSRLLRSIRSRCPNCRRAERVASSLDIPPATNSSIRSSRCACSSSDNSRYCCRRERNCLSQFMVSPAPGPA
jgi:hypothetical protein